MKFVAREMPIVSPVPHDMGDTQWEHISRWLFRRSEWELKKDWFFSIDRVEYVIHKGFVFDGASVPRSLWSVLSPTGILFIPSIIHDYGYKTGKLTPVSGQPVEYDRKRIDNIFRLIAKDLTHLNVVVDIVYYILRIFGRFAWDHN